MAKAKESNLERVVRKARSQGCRLVQVEPDDIREVSVEDLRTNPAQPTQRLSDSALLPLLKAVAESGILTPIMAIRRRVRGREELLIGDGHRRVAVASLLGWDTVWAIVYDHSSRAEAFWAYCNTSRAVQGRDWLTSYAIVSPSYREKHLASFPAKQKQSIALAREVWGEPRLLEIGEQGLIAPILAKEVQWVATQLAGRLGNGRSTTRLAPAQIGDWAIRHQMFFALRMLRNDTNGAPSTSQLERIRDAVLTDQPWQRTGRRRKSAHGAAARKTR